jgi:hypothetical protein
MRALLLMLTLLCPAAAASASAPTYAASPELFHAVQFFESVGRDRALLTLNRATLTKLLESAKKGDPYILFLPGGPVEFRFDYLVTDASKDLDCCSIGLQGENREAVIKLNHSFEVRDFTARVDGEKYRYHSIGHDNFEVLGPRAAVLPPETLR